VRVTILDYGAGNLHSLEKGLSVDKDEVVIESDPVSALDTDVLVFPGVGAFGFAARQLSAARELIRDALAGGLPAIGICLGMQLLFDGSDEGPGLGLGVIGGRVTRVRARRVPHIGWNTLEDGGAEPLLRSSCLSTAYFANAFVCRPSLPFADAVTTWTTHDGDRFPAVVRAHHTVGVQFHPEKSSTAGVRFLRALLDEYRR
jgi:glutamine amidotransferase